MKQIPYYYGSYFKKLTRILKQRSARNMKKAAKRIYAILFSLILICLSVNLNAQTVFKTPSGAKYHLSSCRMVKNVSEEISVAKARELGLTPCKICSPENIYAGAAPPTHKAQGQSTSVECNGKTKTGTRCKHMTRIGNGFCFQHQPG